MFHPPSNLLPGVVHFAALPFDLLCHDSVLTGLCVQRSNLEETSHGNAVGSRHSPQTATEI